MPAVSTPSPSLMVNGITPGKRKHRRPCAKVAPPENANQPINITLSGVPALSIIAYSAGFGSTRLRTSLHADRRVVSPTLHVKPRLCRFLSDWCCAAWPARSHARDFGNPRHIRGRHPDVPEISCSTSPRNPRTSASTCCLPQRPQLVRCSRGSRHCAWPAPRRGHPVVERRVRRAKACLNPRPACATARGRHRFECAQSAAFSHGSAR